MTTKIYQKRIYRDDLKANPEVLYLFGDNLLGVGMGGQAGEMRGEPNAVGIPTKKSPSMADDAFFTDEEFAFNCSKLFAAFARLQRLIEYHGFKAVVLPLDGLGTGLAELNTRAPRTFEYLQNRLEELGG